MLTVTKSIKFDAAHILTNHQGLCKNLHGHTYQHANGGPRKDRRSRAWRRRPDSNWGWGLCRPMPYHLATSPFSKKGRFNTGLFEFLERATGFEPATPTLARLRATNCAKPASARNNIRETNRRCKWNPRGSSIFIQTDKGVATRW